MANLDWPGDILIVSGIATAAFVFLSYWFSAVMSRRNWSLQVKSRPKQKRKEDSE